MRASAAQLKLINGGNLKESSTSDLKEKYHRHWLKLAHQVNQGTGMNRFCTPDRTYYFT
jgi:hypothetical protein